MKKILLIVFLFVGVLHIQAQTPKERADIVKNYDLDKLAALKDKYAKQAKEQKQIAEQKAIEEGWPIKGSKNGIGFELMRLTPDGKPVYYQTENYYAAKTIRTHKLYNGGGLGLNVQGQNMIVGIWDGGPVRGTHNILNGRVIQRDGVSFTTADDLNRHATHVTGTMIANGNMQIRYRGMAFEATAWAHDWYNDDSEMVSEASQGLLVSNHSYGMRAFNVFGQRLIDLYWFGKYNQEARNWDEIMFNAPYYLIVDAAGNDRQYAANGTNKGGYDMLTGNSTCKNNITVAAVRRVNNYSGPSSVVMSSFSNWGPTDDGRIKPDISSQGVDVTSCTSDSNTSVASYDGTSMAAPSVSGSIILLQQHYKESYGNYLKSATVKGLVLHTADEAGNNPGPDYSYGWGLMNTGRAAQAISDNGLKSIIKEITLNEGETYSFTVDADGTVPLMASICWTDPAGEVITGNAANLLDNPTPALVNDLDIRVIKGNSTYYPWKLNPATPSAAATKGDNVVDNFEKVQVDNASGTYTIQVSHKGSLRNGKQAVSIIVTGITNPFAINTKNGDYVPVCVDSSPDKDILLHYSKNANTSGTTQFSITGLPGGVNANFNPSSLSGDGDFTLSLTGLNNAPSGIYNLEVIGTNGSITRSKNIQLHILKNNFPVQNLSSPQNGAVNLRIPVTLNWEEMPNAQEYQIQVAYNQSFDNIHTDLTTTATSTTITNNLSNGNTYYWRVKPKNQCSEGNWSEVRSFTTLIINCSENYFTTQTNIPDNNSGGIETNINIASNETISKVEVYMNITHPKVSDLEVKLESPAQTEITIIQPNTCQGNYTNIDATFHDDADDVVQCDTGSTAISGEYKPFESMAAFVGENAQGDWKLKVYDNVSSNTGTLNFWVIKVCEEVYGVNDQKINLFKVWPNPSNGQINIELEAGKLIDLRLMDISGKEIYHRVYNNSQDVFTKNIIFGNLKKGVYLLQVNSNNKHGVKRIVIE